MLGVIVFGFVAMASAMKVDDATVDRMLSNSDDMYRIFNEFEEEHHREPAEKNMRFREFRKHLAQISEHNHGHYSWKEGINSFVDLTDAERSSHLGLNASMHRATRRKREADEVLSNAPTHVNWIAEEAVTVVKDQGSCGSCWAFGSVGTLEGVYKKTTNVLRNFAEKQVLDCTYPHDGCGGGFMEDGVLAVRDTNGNMLSSTADYPYRPRDEDCPPATEIRNSKVGADVTGYVTIEDGERHTIAALAQRVVTVTIYVNDNFFAYTSGIFRDPYRASWPNHALTGVAYTPEYILVKNSWGSNWGDQGYIKVARNYDGCAFHTMVGYAVMEQNGQTDNNESDPVTDYDPNIEPCQDSGFTACREMYCKYDLVKDACPYTCGECEREDDDDGGDDNDCPSGTIRCDDGVCRHEHMC